MMLCTAFIKLLPDLLRGTLPQGVCDDCEAHLRECASCLDNLAAASAVQWQQADSGVLRESILQATTPGLCATSEILLCDALDGTLSASQRVLLSIHLRDCAACQNLQVHLQSVQAELPQLAAQEPPPSLLTRILRSTSLQPGYGTALPQFLFNHIKTLLLRPRFALEAAFAVTLVWTLLFGVPASVLDTAFAEQPAVISQLELPRFWTQAQAGLEHEMADFGDGVMRPVTALERRLFTSIAELRSDGGAWWRRLTDWIDDLATGLAPGQF